MSPEQIRDEKPNPAMDIYSYGCLIYELTTGRPPFRGTSENDLLQKHFIEKPATPQAYNTDLTDEFGKFCLRLLAKKKDERPKTFHEVLLELKKIRIYKSIDDRDENDRGPM
jgi:serine/threonine-protein kinase